MRRSEQRCAGHMLRTSLLTLAHCGVRRRPAAAHDPTLKARAILPADATWPAPFPAAPNTEPAPAPGSVQPVGGFSALLKGLPGSYLAMPDNGFGSKANSHSLPAPRLRGQARTWTARGRRAILGAISLRDPDHKVPFRSSTRPPSERYLTGGDFDIESFRIDRRGTLWFGDEFGPFLLHTDLTGKVLERADPAPRRALARLPAACPAATPNLAALATASRAWRISPDRRTLYPTLEGPLTRRRRQDDPPVVHVRHRHPPYEPGYRVYHVADPSYSRLRSHGPATRERFVVARARQLPGPRRRHKQAFLVHAPPRRPAGHARGARRAEHRRSRTGSRSSGRSARATSGWATRSRCPYQTIEAVLPLGGDQLAIVNDTNFGSTGRNPALPDYSDFIRVQVSSQSEKPISPHSWREWSSRRATCSSISRVTAAGSK